MTKDTRTLVITVGYLMGVKTETLYAYYGDNAIEVLPTLQANKDATTIHALCKLRTSLMRTFKKTDNALVYDLINLDRMDWFCQKDLKQLTEWGCFSIKANYRAEKYMEDINSAIVRYIDRCSGLFYDWQRWDLIRKLFIIPKHSNPYVMKEEFAKFMANKENYPFQSYIYWEPEECGNILFSDLKFANTIHRLNNEVFHGIRNCKDANDETKQDIYDFIEQSDKIAIIVDCENSDVYKLVGMLKSLEDEEMDKVEKIVLYDGEHTTPGWDWFETTTSIPVEHIEVPRVINHKSLLDVKLTAGVCNDFYANQISSFIIASSDSDYWGLISSLPDADFLVLYERAKCGSGIKEKLKEHDYCYCCLDDFCAGNVEPFKKLVLSNLVKEALPDLSQYNAKEIVRTVFEKSQLYASEKEVQNFYEKFAKNLKITIDQDGNFGYEFNN